MSEVYTDYILTLGEHGSTYGGNPLAAVVATEALKILVDENLGSNAERLGIKFRSEIQRLNIPAIKEVVYVYLYCCSTYI